MQHLLYSGMWDQSIRPTNPPCQLHIHGFQKGIYDGKYGINLANTQIVIIWEWTGIV